MLASEPGAKRGILGAIYLATFLTSVHYAFVAYINSSYLKNFVSQKNLGLLYALASVLTILLASKLSGVLKNWGQFKTVLSVLAADFLAIVFLAAAASPFFSATVPFAVSDGNISVENTGRLLFWMPLGVIFAFLIIQISVTLNRILLDVYLEEFSKESETGGNRGRFLTAFNLAFVLAPFIAGKIITGGGDGFWKVYLLSGVFLALSIILVSARLRAVKDVAYHSPPFLQTIKKMARDKNIWSIFVSSMLLEFFYSWMVIYMPIYLNQSVGFSWEQIGIIFSIMLTAFVIFELPLGKIADFYLGEKEILTAGFIILAVATGLLSFVQSRSIIVWSLALFATRVGASAVEIMNDTYFFKKVRATDTDIISFFRNASPIAYIIGPGLASIILYFIDFKYLFLILGAIMLSGVKFSLAIKDTM